MVVKAPKNTPHAEPAGGTLPDRTPYPQATKTAATGLLLSNLLDTNRLTSFCYIVYIFVYCFV